MSVFGKVLIFFNLLAAGAFAYFTLQNWKVRQELTSAAVGRQILLEGIGLEAQKTPPSSDELGDDREAFELDMTSGKLTSIKKDLFNSIIPKGGEKFGGDPVAHQTAEITRVQRKLQAILATEKTQSPNTYFAWLQTYMLSIARTGAERDGVNALFAMAYPAREDDARRDLPYLARTSSQIAALQALVDIAEMKDPQAITPDETRASRILAGRAAVRRFLIGEVPHGAGGADKQEAERKLKDAVLDALKDGAGEAQKDNLVKAVTAEGEADSWKFLANVAVEPLTDAASCKRATEALLQYAQAKANTDSEKKALAGIKDLIQPPPLNFVKADAIETVSLDLLNSKFDDAARPLGIDAKKNSVSAGEKARKIAHLLYHIDGWRHLDRTPAAVADRKAWHERVATIVGLPNYIKAAEAQASEFAEASQRLIAAITEEQSGFEGEYQTQLQQVLFLYNQWLTLENQYKAQETVTAENERLKNERLTERNKLLNGLADAQQKAQESLVKLQKTQAALFAIQKQLRDAQAALLTLEKELRRLELGS